MVSGLGDPTVPVAVKVLVALAAVLATLLALLPAPRASEEEEEPAPDGAAEPEPGDRGHLVGLRSRPDLNGRRVEVKGPAVGRDGAPRFAVRLLFGAGGGRC